MSDELELAARVHYSFLPTDYDDGRISIAITLRPLRTLGGDYCSVLPLDENTLLICTCDAVGHGIPAALFAARVNTYVLTHAHIDLASCDLVAGLNAYLCKRLGGTGMYASFFALMIDLEAGIMTYTGAAHPPVLHYACGRGTCTRYPSIVTYLGIADPMPLICSSERVRFAPGDRLLLYSDGLVEVENGQRELYGEERLALNLSNNAGLSGQALNRAIIAQAEAFSANGFQDDVLLMSLAIQ